MISRAFLIYSFLVLATTANAQYRGSLQGVVTDPQGAVIPNATITVTSKETSVVKKTATSENGAYAVPGLAPGRYSVAAESAGFTKKIVDNVVLASEQPQTQDVQLSVASQTTQSVTVNGDETPPIETATATVSGTLSGAQIQALPTFSRDPFQAAILAPGAFGDNSRSSDGSGANNLPGSAGPGGTSSTSGIFTTENQVQIVANGTRNNSNSFQVDGIEVNSLAWGGAAVITPNQESVKEVTVQTSPYDASSGRNSGAQVLLVSKNGTNEFHGSGLFRATRPGLDAFQRWNGPGNPVQRDEDRFNQWAASFGGPIIKNHLFFFFSYETLRNSSASIGTGWYETPQFLAAVKGAQPNSIGAKIAGYPGEGVSSGGIIPRSCADAGLPNPAQCQAVSGGLDIGSPLKTPLGTADPSYVSNGTPGIGGGLDGIPDVFFVQTVNPNKNAPVQYNGRIDYQATNNDLIAFTSYYVPNDATFYNGPSRPANLWHSDRLNEAANVLWDHTISPTWLNEARFGVTRWNFNEVASNSQEPWGLPTDNIDDQGGVSQQFFGAPGPGIFAQTTYNFRDTVNTTKAGHSVKLGFDGYLEQDDDTEAYAGRPSYNFRNIWDFANDAPYAESGNFDPKTGVPSSAIHYIRSNIYALFVQDDYKLRPNLTLNIGLRWEYFTPVREKYGNISNAILGSPNPLNLRIKTGGDLYNASKNNWGPQIGFAWRPFVQNNNFVVRSGFGIGYNRLEEAITLNGRNNPPLITGQYLTGSNLVYSTPTDVHQFAGWPSNPAAVQSFDPTTGLPTSGGPIQLTGFPQNVATPTTFRYSLNTEYNLGGNWVAKVGYQGSSTRHYTRQLNYNWFFTPLNPQVQALYFYTNDANAAYNALLVEAEHRFARSFQVDFQYRWSHTIDDGSNDYFIGEYPFDIRQARGDADYDVRHNFKAYGAWNPTIFKGNGWKEKFFGGWQVTGIMSAHTGFPFTPIYGNYGCNIVYANSGYCNLRPAAYLGGLNPDYGNSTFQQPNGYFTKGALSYLAIPNYSGTGIPAPSGVGRNTLRGPGYFDFDAAVQKSFGVPKLPFLGENARFEFRADLFNLFNKLNLQNIGGDSATISYDGVTSNPHFGQSQGGLAGRIVNLQVRFSF